MKTKLFSLLFAIVASTSMLFAESGTCGENLTWDLTDSVLTISGSGAMTNYYSSAPWYSSRQSIKSILLPDALIAIGSRAFFGCTGLTSVTIPNSVTSIGSYAFYSCTGLTSVTIGNSVTSIGEYAFDGCSGLTSIEWNVINCSDFSSSSNAPFYNIRSKITSFTFGDAVEHIPAYLCYAMNKLTSITIPNSVTTIGSYAFEGCSGLTSITIPNSVASIGSYAFRYCTGLTSVEAPAKAFNIHESLWNDYPHKLDSIRINTGELTENVCNYITQSYKTLKYLDIFSATNTELSDEIFQECYKLQTLILPAGLTYINYKSVAECVKLKSIVIPAGVTDIEDRAFEDCRSLDSVGFAGDALRRIGNWAFYNCHALENIEIPAGVTEIGAGAFYGCTYLNNLSMPASVQSIGDNAFALCLKISQMDVDAVEPPAVEDKTFYEVSTEAPVYVPDASVMTYKAHPVWGRLNIIGKSDTPQGIDNANTNVSTRASKILRDGQIFILRGNKVYTLQGQEVK